MNLDELKATMGRVSYSELSQFKTWFDEFFADAWDRQIEADALARKFDKLNKQAAEDIKAGRCTPL